MQLSKAKTLEDVFTALSTGTVSPEASVAEAMWDAFGPPMYHRELTRCDQAREALINLPHNAKRMERNGAERVYHAALVDLHKALSPVEVV